MPSREENESPRTGTPADDPVREEDRLYTIPVCVLITPEDIRRRQRRWNGEKVYERPPIVRVG